MPARGVSRPLPFSLSPEVYAAVDFTGLPLHLLALHAMIVSAGQSANTAKHTSTVGDRKDVAAVQFSEVPLESQIEELSTRYGSSFLILGLSWLPPKLRS